MLQTKLQNVTWSRKQHHRAYQHHPKTEPVNPKQVKSVRCSFQGGSSTQHMQSIATILQTGRLSAQHGAAPKGFLSAGHGKLIPSWRGFLRTQPDQAGFPCLMSHTHGNVHNPTNVGKFWAIGLAQAPNTFKKPGHLASST